MRCPGNVPTLDGNEEVLFEMLIRDGFYSKPPPARPQARSFKKPEPKLSARYLSSNGYSGGQVIVPEVPVLKPEATWPNLLRKKKEVRKTQVFPPTMAVKERPLSIDPMKDYSKPLSVDCSVEYDLPKNIKPPEGADPILKIASPLRPKTPLPTATWFLQPVNNHFFLQSEDQLYLVPVEPIQLVTVPEEQYVDTVILSSGVQTPVVSNDSGRGTDGCRSPMEFLTPEGSRWLYQTDMCTSPEPVATVSDHLLLGHIGKFIFVFRLA
ncbi:hypothetical protein QYM36_015444 [Artemia franciscana]|uniref:Uncharacterized protein n=1 Tax=Artemia franciscana TaxID=6661 RepID=A0AA88KUQ7_ARTSF|nr:hypothetical protein QYM36_015444 [Artemia franciscana]